jgi:hypothetical protein
MADTVREASGDLIQDLITRCMPEQIVDGLEAMKVETEYSQRLFEGRQAAEFAVETLSKPGAVWQSGQGVMA